MVLTNPTISARDVTKSAGDITSCDITILAILSDSIFSYNGFHFVITDVFLNNSGDDVTSDDITIATILSHTIFSHNDHQKGRHFLITVGIFNINDQAGSNWSNWGKILSIYYVIILKSKLDEIISL